MSRIQLGPQREVATRELNIGRILIFCEGKTEKCYFEYYKELIDKNNRQTANKYNIVEIVLIAAGGNAKTVLNKADEFLGEESNCQKYNVYGKYLVFDCDDPPNIQEVIKMAQKYELLISNYSFEIWLLMYFEEVTKKLSKSSVIDRLTQWLNREYKKGDKGTVSEIIRNGNAVNAIDNAKRLELKYEEQGKTVKADIVEMNPYTSVYRFIEPLLLFCASHSK
jgi:hypothetical protein